MPPEHRSPGQVPRLLMTHEEAAQLANDSVENVLRRKDLEAAAYDAHVQALQIQAEVAYLDARRAVRCQQ